MDLSFIGFLVISSFLLFQIQRTHAQCDFDGDFPETIEIPETAEAGKPALAFKLTPDVTGFTAGIGAVETYFELKVDAASSELRFIPKGTLAGYFDNGLNGPTIELNRPMLICGSSPPKDLVYMEVRVIDTNNRSPLFDPPRETFQITLPYSSQAPINWESFIKLTDRDFAQVNTEIQLVTIDSPLVQLYLKNNGEIERVPPNPNSRLEYYKLYISLADAEPGSGSGSDSSVLPGTYVINVTATDNGGNVGVYEMTLIILKGKDTESPAISGVYNNPYFKNVVGTSMKIAIAEDNVTVSSDLKATFHFPEGDEDSHNFAKYFNQKPIVESDGSISISLVTKIPPEISKSVHFIVRFDLRVEDKAGNSEVLSIALPFDPIICWSASSGILV